MTGISPDSIDTFISQKRPVMPELINKAHMKIVFMHKIHSYGTIVIKVENIHLRITLENAFFDTYNQSSFDLF